MYRLLLSTLCILLAIKAQAQIPCDSKILLDSGLALYEKHEFKKSLEQYRLIPEGDTNYTIAQQEQVLSLIADSAYDEAKKLALYNLAQPETNKRAFMLSLATDYDYMKMEDSSLAVYERIMKMFPHDNQPYYETGIVYFRKKNYDKALEYFQRSLVMNPGHFNSHYMTGLLYLLQGRLSEAMIALQTSMLMTTNATTAKQSIRLMSSITEQTDETVKLYHEKSEKNSHPLFDDIDQLVNSKLALQKDYKLKMSLNDNLFRQIQVIMEKLKYDSTDNNFVMQYYVPLLTELYSKDQVEPYMLLLFSDFGLENVDEAAKKNSKEIAEVRGVVFPYYGHIKTTRELNYAKRQRAKELYHFYGGDNTILVGNAVKGEKNDIAVGPARLYRMTDHTLKAIGQYNDKGEKEGLWTRYYANGKVASYYHYAKDNAIDSSYDYYSNGNTNQIITRNKEAKVAAVYKYNYKGWLSSIRTRITDDAYEERTYYSNGQLEMAAKYEGDNMADGPYTVYYSNGKIKRTFPIKAGKTNGEVKRYYENGPLHEIVNFTKDQADGPYSAYYENGQLKEKYAYEHGKEQGAYEEYSDKGKLTEKGVYSKGSKELIYRYNRDGQLYCTFVSRGEVPTSIKYTNEHNDVMMDTANKNGLFSYPLYHYNGNKSVDMKINEKGRREGSLTFYTANGVKSEESDYKDGNLEGKFAAFNNHGKIINEGTYHDDKRDGYFKRYYNNGVVKNEGWYREGKKQGVWKNYYINGKPETINFMQNDMIDGFDNEYNINGELTDRYIYDYGALVSHTRYDTMGNKADSVYIGVSNGRYSLPKKHNAATICDVTYEVKYGTLNGEDVRKFPNGAIKERKYFKGGNNDSVYTLYYPDGSIRTKGQYSNGSRIGKWEYYNEAGGLFLDETYNNNGDLEGSATARACNQPRVTYHRKNGEKDSAQVYYGENGRIALLLYYNEDILTGYAYEGKDGKMLPEIKIKNNAAQITAYYSNGQKSAEGNFEHGNLEGALKIYYSNGKLQEERNITNQDFNGPFRRYNEDGTLVYEVIYKDDKEMGVEKTYDKKGNLIISAEYYYGQLHGPTIVKDPVSGKTKTYHYHYGEISSVD